ncbi:MAG: hypothetical protein HOE36_07390 [Flavobacteriaceae bacterium]|jgi:hypothetical protein|nr:hypothetical protein [Flavobacteriaceae bacterium]
MGFEIIKVRGLLAEDDELIGRIFPISIDGNEVSDYQLIKFDSPYALLKKISDEEE